MSHLAQPDFLFLKQVSPKTRARQGKNSWPWKEIKTTSSVAHDAGCLHCKINRSCKSFLKPHQQPQNRSVAARSGGRREGLMTKGQGGT